MIANIIGLVILISCILGYGAILLYLARYERKSNPKDKDKKKEENDD